MGWANVEASPLWEDSGNVSYSFLLYTDINEQCVLFFFGFFSAD